MKKYNEFIEGRNKIKKALSNYKNCNQNEKENTGYELIRAMRNGIESISGVSVEVLYKDTVAFNKLVGLAETV